VLEQCGGWYFDVDTFALRPISEIEGFDEIGNRLFVPLHRGTAQLTNPILGASLSCEIWPVVHQFIANTTLPQYYLDFSNRLMTYLRRSHPALLQLGNPDDFSVEGEYNLRVYRRLVLGRNVQTKACMIHGFVGLRTACKPQAEE